MADRKLAAIVNTGRLAAAVQRSTDRSADGGGGDCSVMLSEDTLSFDKEGGSQDVTVTAANSNTISYGVSDAAWLSVTGPTNGSGTATITAASTVPGRTGTVSICGQTITITQAGGPPLGDCSDAPALIHWWKADAGVYSDAGITLATNLDSVRQWNDQVGTLHLSQATSGNRPQYQDNYKNNLPCVIFDGLNDFLVTGNTSLTDSDNGYEMFYVFKLREWVGGAFNSYLFSWHNKFDLTCSFSGVSPAGRLYSAGWHTDALTPDLKPGAWALFDLSTNYPAGGVTAQVNQDAPNSDGSSFDALESVELSIACQAGTEANICALDVAEILVYECPQSVPVREAVIAYLNEKWGIY